MSKQLKITLRGKERPQLSPKKQLRAKAPKKKVKVMTQRAKRRTTTPMIDQYTYVMLITPQIQPHLRNTSKSEEGLPV